MEASSFSGKETHTQDKETLQPETRKKAREAMKAEAQHFTDAPEIQHFAVEKVGKNDNAYGIKWGNLVREYLKAAYRLEDLQEEVVSDGITYQVLKRRGVTTFYDEDGNTLFDVENKRLEKEYGYVMQEDKVPVGPGEEKKEAESGNDVPAGGITAPDPAGVKQMAKEKLEKELQAAKDKPFADPVIGYLLKRCKEDLGLSQDVVQGHKTWQKCFDYICSQARKQAKGNCAAVPDGVAYEWAEDYYHRDDKAEEEKKAREAAERKKKQAQRAKKVKSEPQKAEAPKPKEEPKSKKKSKDMDGQLDLFSLMGM